LVTGFTAGIAVIIVASQLKDLLGLQVSDVPAEFLPKLGVLWAHLDSVNGWALGLAMGCIATIVGLRKLAPSAPGFLVAVVLASAAVALLGLPVDTIGSRFGGVPSSLPLPALPALDLARCIALLPAALTIAFLAGIES